MQSVHVFFYLHCHQQQIVHVLWIVIGYIIEHLIKFISFGIFGLEILIING